MVKIKPRSPLGSPEKKRFTLDLLMVPYFIIALAIVLLGVKIMLAQDDLAAVMPTNAYQAVFLNNGQVYFGHLAQLNRNYFTLTDVYYIQQQQGQPAAIDATGAASTQTTEPQAEFTVIRMGDEIHEPQNLLVINKDQVIFWENLKPDSRVIDAIDQDRAAR